jgi:hypothetical protein
MLRIAMIAALLAVPAAAGAADAEKKKERRICKREIATGSNVRPKRTCLTAEEWKQAEQYNRETTSAWQRAIDGKQRGN